MRKYQSLDELGSVELRGTVYDFSEAENGKIRCRAKGVEKDAWFEYEIEELLSIGLAFDTIEVEGEKLHGVLSELNVRRILDQRAAC